MAIWDLQKWLTKVAIPNVRTQAADLIERSLELADHHHIIPRTFPFLLLELFLPSWVIGALRPA